MTVAVEGVQTKIVPMTPRGDIVWDAVACEEGVLYASSGCDRDMAQLLIRIATSENQQELGTQYVNKGDYGIVTRLGDIAFKKSFDIEPDEVAGLEAVQANVGLGYGLNAINQDTLPERTKHTQRPFQVTTPAYYAAFMPRPDRHPSRQYTRQTVAMSFEEGIIVPPFADIPVWADRKQRYDAAARESRLNPALLNYDEDYDGSNGNLLIQIHPDRLILKVLDVMVAENALDDFRRQYGYSRIRS